MDKILISLDPSSVSTGYAVFKNEKLETYGVIQEKSKNVLERINNISQKIDELLEEYKPDEIALEDITITLSAPTAKALMGLQLIIELKAFDKGIKCEALRTTNWRKTLGLSNSPKLKREEKKREAMEYVNKKFMINESLDDICDAICIGEAYMIKRDKESREI